MFENLLHQNASSQIKNDITKSIFPGAVLFAGPKGSGKLTCALETARILSCMQTPKARWNCTCPSCLRHKSLTQTNLLLTGPRDCTPEIKASRETFLCALKEKQSFLDATRYLFLRSIRKLTLRFNQVLWEGDDKLNKIAVVMQEIDENLELLDFPRALPEFEEVEKISEKLIKLTEKLETEFLYDSLPVSQVRNISSWARVKTAGEKNTVIIENADRMLENVRNALLKILEEPPENTVFILTATRRSAVMPTILSRVRLYNFVERSAENQLEVIRKVYHDEAFNGNVEEFLQGYLPLSPSELQRTAYSFVEEVTGGVIPEISSVIKDCKNFEPRDMLKIFLDRMNLLFRPLMKTSKGTLVLEEVNKAIFDCYNSVTVYNQGVQAAFERLARELVKINRLNGNIFRCVIM